MNTIKQIATIIFTVLVFIFFSELLSAKFSLSDFFKGSPKPTISIYLLPSYKTAISACNYFDEQIKSYQDAYLTGDSGLIMMAKDRAHGVRNCLQFITEEDLPSHLRNDLNDLLQDYDNYTKKANSAYLSIAEGNLEHQNAILELAQEQRAINTKLNQLTQYFYKELSDSIEKVNEYYKL